MMEFDEFAEMLVSRLGSDYDGERHPETGIFDDLGVDSFQAFQMLIIIETAAELDVPPAELPSIFTLADAFAYFELARSLAASSP